MKKLIATYIGLCLFSCISAFAASTENEQITDFSEDSVPVVNEVLRRLKTDNLQIDNRVTILENAGTGMTNPMDDIGQMIYGGVGGVPTKLVAGATGNTLQAQGSAAPIWATVSSGTSQSDVIGLIITLFEMLDTPLPT